MAKIERLQSGKTYYLRAFAENSAGTSYGAVRRIKLENLLKSP